MKMMFQMLLVKTRGINNAFVFLFPPRATHSIIFIRSQFKYFYHFRNHPSIISLIIQLVRGSIDGTQKTDPSRTVYIRLAQFERHPWSCWILSGHQDQRSWLFHITNVTALNMDHISRYRTWSWSTSSLRCCSEIWKVPSCARPIVPLLYTWDPPISMVTLG